MVFGFGRKERVRGFAADLLVSRGTEKIRPKEIRKLVKKRAKEEIKREIMCVFDMPKTSKERREIRAKRFKKAFKEKPFKFKGIK